MAVPSFFRSDGWVKTATGAALPGAQVFLVQQPANLVGTPTPLQQIYADPMGLIPITQPILTDGLGHYDFYVTPGTYTLAVFLNAILQESYADQSIGLGGVVSGTTSGGIYYNSNGILSRIASFNFVIDGGGSTPGTGAYGQVNVPTGCTVTGWTLTADQSGSAVIDVLRSTYAGFPTTTTIANTDKPTLSSVQKNENLAVSAWTTALNAGDQLQVNLNSVTTCTRLNLSVLVTIP
jgi:hypothetical protein